jgi:putative transposase
MLKAYRYRIYPNEEQQIIFAKTFGCVRFIYNKMLSEKIEALKNKQPLPTITPAKYKSQFPFLREVDSLALANAQQNLERAFKNFYKKQQYIF